jgi:hypothetical protein
MFVLPHSGHWVIEPSGGASTLFHSLLPAGASYPHFRQRDGCSVELVRDTAIPRFRKIIQCFGFGLRVIVNRDGSLRHSSMHYPVVM